MATIPLAKGTEHVRVAEVPGLLAAAIHPPDVRPRTLSYIVAVRSERDRGRKLTKWQKRWLESSGIAVPGANSTESDWRAFALKLDSFRATRRRPPAWVPAPVWTNHSTNAEMLRLVAEGEHRRALQAAIARGDVRCLNHARLPSGGFPNDLIPVDDLRSYVEPMGVQIVIGANGLAEADAPPAPPKRREKATTQHDDNVIAALKARNIDPLNMPAAPLGNKPWPLREDIAKELGISTNTAKKAFTRLRKYGRMKSA